MLGHQLLMCFRQGLHPKPALCFSTTKSCFLRGKRKKESEGLVAGCGASSELWVEKFVKEKSTKELLDRATTYNEAVPAGPDDVWSKGPYPHDSNYKQSQAKFSHRPVVDPKETSIILFPGQGTQFLGMGKDLLKFPNVQEMYEAASAILGYDLLKVCLEGPKRDLDRTVFQQPAIVVSSLAAVEKLREERPSALEHCVGVAGFSVGEITALTFAGSLSFENAIRLVKVRAEAMQLASEIVPSGMMTVFYGPDSRLGFACSVAKEFCHRQGLTEIDCRVANFLYPHCKVVAGNDEALQFIIQNSKDFRLKKIKRLAVSGAFHTDLMRPAAEALKKVLKNMEIESPFIPVHSNIDGKRYRSAQHIRNFLPKQIYSPVRWEQTMHIIYERSQETNFPKSYECGPGSSLRTILKMVNSKAADVCHSVQA